MPRNTQPSCANSWVSGKSSPTRGRGALFVSTPHTRLSLRTGRPSFRATDTALRKRAEESQRLCLLTLEVPETKRVETENFTHEFFNRFFYFDWIDNFIAGLRAS